MRGSPVLLFYCPITRLLAFNVCLFPALSRTPCKYHRFQHGLQRLRLHQPAFQTIHNHPTHSHRGGQGTMNHGPRGGGATLSIRYVPVSSFDSAGLPPPHGMGLTMECRGHILRLHHQHTSRSTLHGRSGNHARDIIHTPCTCVFYTSSCCVPCVLSWVPTIWGNIDVGRLSGWNFSLKNRISLMAFSAFFRLRAEIGLRTGLVFPCNVRR